jgi:dsDNA-specific endonuclease/ATPase MutS2
MSGGLADEELAQPRAILRVREAVRAEKTDEVKEALEQAEEMGIADNKEINDAKALVASLERKAKVNSEEIRQAKETLDLMERQQKAEDDIRDADSSSSANSILKRQQAARDLEAEKRDLIKER